MSKSEMEGLVEKSMRAEYPTASPETRALMRILATDYGIDLEEVK